MSVFPQVAPRPHLSWHVITFLFTPFHSVRAQWRRRAQSPDSKVSSMRATLGRPCESLIAMGRGGPGSVCFLQRPEGELQSSSSWPLHHCPDTDRLHLLGFLTPSRPAPFLCSSSFSTLSTPPNSIFPSFLLLFSACFYLGFALQELIKSVTLDPLLMSGLWFFLFSTLVLYNTFIHLLPASPPLVTWHYVEETPQTNISTVHILQSRDLSYSSRFFFFFFFYLHTYLSSAKPFLNL